MWTLRDSAYSTGANRSEMSVLMVSDSQCLSLGVCLVILGGIAMLLVSQAAKLDG